MQAGSSPTWRFDAELAWLGFWRRPARTLVGTWAVIVAVAAVTFVLSLGDGLHEYLSRRLQAFTPALWSSHWTSEERLRLILRPGLLQKILQPVPLRRTNSPVGSESCRA